MALLELEDVSVHFSVASTVVRAVDGVSVAIEPGEILGIVGESGSGKSTLGRVVAGFQEVTSGTVTAASSLSDIRRGKPDGRMGVQMIFQESSTSLNPRLPVIKSIAESVVAGGRITGDAIERAERFLDEVRLPRDVGRRRPREISGGQRQRISIARALAASPEILVCDEAVASLDVAVRAEIVNLLAEIQSTHNVAMAFISHDMSVVSQLADRIVVMYHGQIVEQGLTRAVIEAPEHEYTKRLMDAVPRLERQFRTGV